MNILRSGSDLTFDKWPHFLFPIKLLVSIGPIIVMCITICRYLLYVRLCYFDFDS